MDGKYPWIVRELKRSPAGTFFAIAVALASGCGAARPSKYYQLAGPNDLRTAKVGGPYPVTLMVGRLQASHLYREDRIVYSGRGEEVGTYEYQRWVEPPTEMIEEMLLRDLRASGRYRGVYSLGGETRGDYVLRGHVFDLKEVSGATLLARVALELELRDSKSGATVWTHYYTHDEPVSAKDISSVVAALNRNVQQAITEMRVSLDEYFTLRAAK